MNNHNTTETLHIKRDSCRMKDLFHNLICKIKSHFPVSSDTFHKNTIHQEEMQGQVNAQLTQLQNSLANLQNVLASIQSSLIKIQNDSLIQQNNLRWIQNTSLSNFAARIDRTATQTMPEKNHFLLMNYEYPGYCNTNIGDNVQTIAVKNALTNLFSGCRFSYWNKDNLINYSGESVQCIYQGWFAHNYTDFLPSPKILPVYYGMHFSKKARETFLFLRYNTNFFWNQEIGCRDLSSMKFCESIGIRSYFSRCLTLTLPASTIPKTENVYLVNVPKEYENFIPKNIMQHAVSINQKNVPVANVPSIQSRYAYAQWLLSRYASASCVITTAIHCAMPCIAMGIPVILINPLQWGNNTFDGDRLTTMQGLLNPVTMQDFIEHKVDFSPAPLNIEPLKKMLLENLKLSILQMRGESIDFKYLQLLRKEIAEFHV